MSKLIATEFTYTLRDEFGQEHKGRGSYLGRKIATTATLRRFMRQNIRTYTPLSKLATLTPAGNYVSQWIAK